VAHEVNIHEAQTAILRELLFKPDASYSELRKKTGLESDHFKFHLRRLVEIDLTAKNASGRYCLTPKGKEYANKIDTDRGVIERQPKSAVIIVLQNEQGNVLVQQRLKQPFYGFWGYPGGKIRWKNNSTDRRPRADGRNRLERPLVLSGHLPRACGLGRKRRHAGR
jgi:predicted transcriptional regulator